MNYFLVFPSAMDYNQRTNVAVSLRWVEAFELAMFLAEDSGKKTYVVQPNSCVVEVGPNRFITGSHTDIAPNYDDILVDAGLDKKPIAPVSKVDIDILLFNSRQRRAVHGAT